MGRWTVGTIVLIGVASFLLLSLLLSVSGTVLSTLEEQLKEPTNPTLKALYKPLYTVYTFLKAALTNKYVVALLLALSLVAIALEAEWRRRY